MYIRNNNEEAINYIKKISSTGDVILVKASNGMHFDEIVEQII